MQKKLQKGGENHQSPMGFVFSKSESVHLKKMDGFFCILLFFYTIIFLFKNFLLPLQLEKTSRVKFELRQLSRYHQTR